jgi:hypothetical protein
MLVWKKHEPPRATRNKEFAFLDSLAQMRGKPGLPLPPPTKPTEHKMEDLVDFAAEIGDLSPAEQSEAVALAWAKALDEVEQAYPAGDWEILIIYFTVETGDAMIYPATMARLDDGSAKVRIVLHSIAWENAYAAITEPEESRKFDTAYNKVLKSIVKTFKDAVENSAVSTRFNTLKKRSSFGIYYVDGVETVRREGLHLLWGNKAPDGLPAGSAKEVFEALLRRESSYIGKSFVYEV